MNLKFFINSAPFELGELVDIQNLERAEFSKSGPLHRLINHIHNGQSLYRAENCKVVCFNEEFSLYPCTHGYLNRDRQWKTSASIYLMEDRIHKLEFQVIEGRYAATNFLERFQNACRNHLGEPTENSRYVVRWVNGAAVVVSTLHRDRFNADFLLEFVPGS